MRLQKQEDREKFLEDLEAPLEGESIANTRVSQESIERENDGFDALMGMTGGRG